MATFLCVLHMTNLVQTYPPPPGCFIQKAWQFLLEYGNMCLILHSFLFSGWKDVGMGRMTFLVSIHLIFEFCSYRYEGVEGG